MSMSIIYPRSRTLPKLKNDLIIRLANGEKVERIPVWMLRQSGYYLPKFAQICNAHTLDEIYTNPKLVSEITQLPLEYLDVDAVIIFADSFALLKILGINIESNEKGSLTISNPLMTPDDSNRLEKNIQLNQELKPLLDAISLTRHELDGKVPLIGFSLAPWTLLAYLVEGMGETKWFRAKSWLYLYPDTSQQLLIDLRFFVVDFLVDQFNAGAQILMVIDSLASVLGKEQFMKFSYPQLKEIASEVKQRITQNVPIMLYIQGAHFALSELSELDYQIIGIDWRIEPEVARVKFGNKKILMGNFDPVGLLADEKEVERETKAMVGKFGKERYIANLGDGIYPPTPLENVKKFVDTIHSIKVREK